MSIHTLIPTVIDPSTDLNPPRPDWGFIGVGAATDIYNGIYTIVLILAGIGALIGAGLIIFGKVGEHSGAFKAGLWTLGGCVAGAAIATGASALVNFGSGLDIS